MQYFIMMVGPAGCGKTTIAKTFAAKNGYSYVSTDDIRKEMYGDASVQEHANKVFNRAHNEIMSALKNGKSVVFDATNLISKRRVNLLKQLPSSVRKWAMVVATDPKVIFERNANRERVVPDDVILRQLCSFSTPGHEEGFDEVYVEHTTPLADINNIHKLCDIPHDNPHHQRGIEEHMIAASEQAAKDGMNELVVNVLCHHDIGKPFTKALDENGVAHFYGHAGYGAYLLLCSNCKDRLHLSWFIARHMELMNGLSFEKCAERYGSDAAYILSLISQYDKESA